MTTQPINTIRKLLLFVLYLVCSTVLLSACSKPQIERIAQFLQFQKEEIIIRQAVNKTVILVEDMLMRFRQNNLARKNIPLPPPRDNNDIEMIFDSRKYIYAKIDNYSGIDDSELYTMMVLDASNKTIAYHTTPLNPGCLGYNAISQLKINYKSLIDLKLYKMDAIIFCGSNHGRHNTAYFMTKYGEILGVLDFLDGEVNFHQASDTKDLYAILYLDYYFPGYGKISYNRIANIVFQDDSNNLIISYKNHDNYYMKKPNHLDKEISSYTKIKNKNNSIDENEQIRRIASAIIYLFLFTR
ncbi:hypothetical protein [uncultured Cardiobacterium sp.]|uniref:hypothetical protein n=1 Tax=uncultured Cardiobacterium sp. TaxID=417619 RepID=UPI00261D5159|nr:hypothetical protein [uncultured Cardiobacterium sp.]